MTLLVMLLNCFSLLNYVSVATGGQKTIRNNDLGAVMGCIMWKLLKMHLGNISMLVYRKLYYQHPVNLYHKRLCSILYIQKNTNVICSAVEALLSEDLDIKSYSMLNVYGRSSSKYGVVQIPDCLFIVIMGTKWLVSSS